MALTEELGLKNGIKDLGHEAVLNIYYTASQVKKRATDFFKKFCLTDVQFNVLILLEYQADESGGLTQAKLSDMMLVNRANITSLVDRMEKAGLVIRTNDESDRRSNVVKMTNKGKKIFEKVEPLYIEQVRQVMSPVSIDEQKKIISALEKVRTSLKF